MESAVSCFEFSWQQTVSTTLLDYLLAKYPTGMLDEGGLQRQDAVLKNWLSQVKDYCSEQQVSDQHRLEDLMEQAIAAAVTEWKEKTPLAPPSKSAPPKVMTSFSLFSSGGGSLLPAMGDLTASLVDQIHAASNEQERLHIWQLVFHVDDVIEDWKEIRELVRNGLEQGDVLEGYLQLHMKWFQQCRTGGGDYVAMQQDLCRNILHVIIHSSKRLDEELLLLWTDWNDMWIDLMQQQHCVLDEKTFVHDTLLQIFQLILDQEQHSSLLVQVDPLAQWFQAWMVRTNQPDTLLELLHQTPRFVPTYLIQNVANPPKDDNDDAVLIVYRHNLCVLSTILCCTRVSGFCWDDWMEAVRTNTSTEQLSPPLRLYQQLLNIFLHGIKLKQNNNTNTVCDQNSNATCHSCRLMCARAIETILLGCSTHHDATTIFATLFKQVQDATLDEEVPSMNPLVMMDSISTSQMAVPVETTTSSTSPASILRQTLQIVQQNSPIPCLLDP